MRLAIRRWGNSLALRLPAAVLREVELAEGSEVNVAVEGQQLLITKVAPLVTLDQLLADVTPENVHGEIPAGPPRGREIW